MPITISIYIAISCHYSLELSFTSIYISHVLIHNSFEYILNKTYWLIRAK